MGLIASCCSGAGHSQGRHDLMDSFMDKRGGLLTLIPLVVILAVAPFNILAAVWTAFGVQLFLSLIEWYRSRYNSKVAFPNIVNTSQLLSYILCVILVYALNPPLQSRFIGPIVITFVFSGMFLSLVFQYPFTLQTSSSMVDEDTRKSLGFYRFNQIVTGFWVLVMSVATACTWCSLLFESNSPGQIVLAIVMPIVLPAFGHLTTPYLVKYLRARAAAQTQTEDVGFSPIV